MGNCLITWKTRKQPTVSLSISEAEYKALADLSTEVLWLRQLIQELNLMKISKPVTIFDDNQECINTANGDCNSNGRRMKHIEIQLQFIREVIELGIIEVLYVPSCEMLADFLTKSVCRPALQKCLLSLGVLCQRDKGGVESESE
ncbi:hypothetical protein O181_114887 [Austropuccinia psidii MF-1]|uniref:Copia protein n=1 Tax=Austropuccinia psidii MF-1 TaxID=1389203 RepID=A0A9Q3K6F3_9BASI|nr:hypothetical protein [Austropuccinia psidii MF-1]